MAIRELLTADDWQVLQMSVASVFKHVALADGKIDKKETKAFESIMANAAKLKSDIAKELIQSIADPSDILNMLEKSGEKSKDVLQKASLIMDQKLDEKTSLELKKHLVALGIYIGNASGSLFDYTISHDEKDAVREVGKYIGVSVKDLEQTNILIDIINSLD